MSDLLFQPLISYANALIPLRQRNFTKSGFRGKFGVIRKT